MCAVSVQHPSVPRVPSLSELPQCRGFPGSPPFPGSAPEGGAGSNRRGACWAVRVTLGSAMVVAALGRAAGRLLRAGAAVPGRRR